MRLRASCQVSLQTSSKSPCFSVCTSVNSTGLRSVRAKRRHFAAFRKLAKVLLWWRIALKYACEKTILRRVLIVGVLIKKQNIDIFSFPKTISIDVVHVRNSLNYKICFLLTIKNDVISRKVYFFIKTFSIVA